MKPNMEKKYWRGVGQNIGHYPLKLDLDNKLWDRKLQDVPQVLAIHKVE